MQQLADTRAAMNEAETVVREDLFINAIKMCDALFYNNADVERVRAMKDKVIALNEESRKALWVLDKVFFYLIFLFLNLKFKKFYSIFLIIFIIH